MAKLIRPPKTVDVKAYLIALYLQTEQELVNEINRKRRSGYVDYAEVAALERVQEILQNMIDTSWTYVPLMVEKAFYKKLEKHVAGYGNARILTSTQTGIVKQLTNNLLGQILEAAEISQMTVENIILGPRDEGLFRSTALRSVAEQQSQGSGISTARAGMRKELLNNKITSFTDKAGRTWGLGDYCSMAVRTTARQAEIAAILTEDPEHDLYQISKIGSTCPLCASLEGRVYSRSGTNPDYPSLSVAFGKVDDAGPDTLENTYLNIHPNCLHALIKYTTIGKTDKQIQRDKDFSSLKKNPLENDPRSKRQIEEYRSKVRNRQKLLNDRKQFQQYQQTLGKDCPKTFDKFKKLKYSDAEKWKETQALFRKTNAYNKIVKCEPAITEDLLRISERMQVKMVGLEHRLKTKESFLRKVDKKSSGSLESLEVKKAVSGTSDVIRYTYQDSAQNLTKSYHKITQELGDKGYELVEVNNTWLDKRNPYNGINCKLKTPEGQLFEVQFHTPESYRVKDTMHKDYEAWRVLDAASPEAVALRKKMLEESHGMEVPVDIEKVKK